MAYQVHGSAIKSRHCQCKDGGVEKTPTGISQVNQVLGSIVMYADILKDRTKEISLKNVNYYVNCERQETGHPRCQAITTPLREKSQE